MKVFTYKELLGLPNGVLFTDMVSASNLFRLYRKVSSNATTGQLNVESAQLGVADMADMAMPLTLESCQSWVQLYRADGTAVPIPAERSGLQAHWKVWVLTMEEVDLYSRFVLNSAAGYHQLQRSHLQHKKHDIPEGAIHVDEWLDQTPMFFGERKILGYVHFMLNEMRYSATWILAHRETMEQHALYVTYDNKRWKVTGASRMGDLFLAQNLTRKNGEGYDIRVPLDFSKLTEWSDSPVVDCPDEYTSIEGQYDTGGGWWADIYTPKGNLLMSGLRLGEAKPILDNLNTTYKAQKSDTGATTTPPVSSSVDLHFNRHFTG